MYISRALDEGTTHVTCRTDHGEYSFDRWLRHLQDDNGSSEFSRLIAAHPAAAVFWELPPLTSDRLPQPFECVLISSPALARLPNDPVTFSGYFRARRDVAVFENLGGDATLVVPAPVPVGAQYPHLAAFCRTAPEHLIAGFWRQLALTAQQEIKNEPLWISTAGLGVGWLHARLDSRPKYYSHAPYRRWPQ